MPRTSPTVGMMLHTIRGRRKYLTPGERLRFLEAASAEPPEIETLCLTLAWTGCRVSEALGLTHADVDHDSRIVTVRCLKKRRGGIVREVPVPAELPAALARVHGAKAPDARLWPMARSTAWRHVKRVMQGAGVGATAASPKGLRHGFGVHAVRSGVPLNLLQRWLGHASMATTAIYADVMGAEEQEIAARMRLPTMSTLKPRGIGLAAVLLLFQAGTASAVELPEAVGTWFGTDRSIVCVDPDGNDRRCAIDVDTHMELRRSPDASTAMAFVTCLPDPTGNVTDTKAAIFRAVGTGWRHVRTLTEVRNPLAGKVTFSDRTVTFAVAVPRKGDGHCCPTGRKTYRVALP